VTDLYEHSQNLFDRETLHRIAHGHDPLDFHDLFAVHRSSDSGRLDDVKEPIVIIAGSGMCTGGRVVGHLQKLLPHPQHTVLFVGFQAPETTGAAIQSAARGRSTVPLGGEHVPVRARIETLGGLSAHADRRELLRWLRAVPGVKRVGLNHGEPESQKAFAAWAE
jgi:metallo-beta-lactamase family protein